MKSDPRFPIEPQEFLCFFFFLLACLLVCLFVCSFVRSFACLLAALSALPRMAGSHPSRRGPLGGLKFILAAALPILVFSLFVSTAKAETCWGVDGRKMINNRVCPGSNACCGETATCLSNRLCHNDGDPPDLWIRGPCFTKGWGEGSTDCAQICAYSEFFLQDNY